MRSNDFDEFDCPTFQRARCAPRYSHDALAYMPWRWVYFLVAFVVVGYTVTLTLMFG